MSAEEIHLTPQERQQRLVAKLAGIPDPQERMALLAGRGRKLPPLRAEQKVEENRVKGCSSQVWLVPQLREDGRCTFGLEADSTVVKGLAASLCEIYEGCTPAEVAGWEPSFLEELQLARHLSPTRSHGLEQIRKAMREWAAAQTA